MTLPPFFDPISMGRLLLTAEMMVMIIRNIIIISRMITMILTIDYQTHPGFLLPTELYHNGTPPCGTTYWTWNNNKPGTWSQPPPSCSPVQVTASSKPLAFTNPDICGSCPSLKVGKQSTRFECGQLSVNVGELSTFSAPPLRSLPHTWGSLHWTTHTWAR